MKPEYHLDPATEASPADSPVAPDSTGCPAPMTAERRERDRLLEDLRVHQAELELQNQELRGIQMALEASRQRYFTLFDLAPVPCFVFDQQHAVVEMNFAAAELVGLARGEPWSRPFSLFLTEESRPVFHEHLRAAFSAGQVMPAELRLEPRAGGLRHIVMRSAWLAAQDDEAPRVLAAVSDVTVLRDAERKQRELEAHLFQSQKLESLGTLAGGMAHDFNNILQVISGFAELALQGGDPEAVRESVEQIRSAATRAGQLTRQILAFSRRQPMESTEFSLNQLLVAIEPTLRRIVRPGVEVRIRPADGLPTVIADRRQVEQAVSNLVVNACDAMPHGGVVELVTALLPGALAGIGTASGARDAVVLAVKDFGVGMAPEVQAHLFEPFFTTKPRGRGTGLGLAMVHGMVRQHGGEIRVDSRVGQGTTITLLLPSTGRVPAAAMPLAEPARSGGGRWILFAEDEPALRKLGELLLTRRGFRVLCARDGLDAVELYRHHSGEPIAAFVFDVMMPRMGGVEAFRELRRSGNCPPVLFVSGFPGDVPIEADRPELVRFLRKPFTESEMFEALDQVLRAVALSSLPTGLSPAAEADSARS